MIPNDVLEKSFTATISVRFTDAEKKKLHEQADKLGVSLSQLVRVKATGDLSEQITEHLELTLKKFREQLNADLQRSVTETEVVNDLLLKKLAQLFRTDEY